MIIDFHTHAFPDNLAERAIGGIVRSTRDVYEIERPVYCTGRTDDLKRQMRKNGIDMSVVLPIATKVGQYHSINDYAEKITGGELISFASLHPYDENVEDIVKDIAKRGFKGIKLHPEYQGFYVDDDRAIKLVKTACENGLYTLFHAGEDLGVPAPFHSSPDRFLKLFKQADESMIILAHMGGFRQWDEVEEKLVCTKAYFDTAVVSKFMNIDLYKRIIDKHGADRILFGSDDPWENPLETLEFLKISDVDKEQFELITYKNAKKLLNL